MNSSQPLISIIIPSFNQGQFIEQTITSILGQDYPNKELIVIDGGSTDNTRSIVKKYERSISHYISEPDNGQAHAINKGFRLAKGDIMAWLNTDDIYLPCAFSKAATALRTQSVGASGLVYGGCLHFYEGTTYTYGSLPPTHFDAERLTYEDYIVQPSTFWTRKLWESVGELNESYHYVLDWEWFIRASKICRFIPFGEYFSMYRFHKQHKSSSGSDKRQEEIVQMIETYASEEWIAVYRDVYDRILPLRTWLHRLSRLKLFWMRAFLYPRLYWKHGKYRIEDVVLTMLILPDISTEPRFNKLTPDPSYSMVR